jgi:hypothetical protein
LCYRACPTDDVPIPGEPCRSEDEATASSRWQDDFHLELRYDPPEQLEEDALADFIEWLRQIPLDDASTTTLDQLVDALRSAIQIEATETAMTSWLEPPAAGFSLPSFASSEFYRRAFLLWTTEMRPLQVGLHSFIVTMGKIIDNMAAHTTGTLATLPEFNGWIVEAAHLNEAVVTPGHLDERVFANKRIEPAEIGAYRTAALEVWRTTLQPRWVAVQGSSALASGEEYLLLARADIVLNAEGDVAIDSNGAPQITLDERRRPYVVHLRMLQEWLLSEVRAAARGDGPLPGEDVTDETTWGIERRLGTPGSYARADHSHGSPPDPIPPHVNDNTAHNTHAIAGDVTGTLAAAAVERIRGVNVSTTTPTEGQILTFVTDSWQPSTPSTGGGPTSAAGDVTGDLGTTTVERIRGVNVSTTTPTEGQVLTFVTDSWQPAPPTTSSGSFVGRPDDSPRYQVVAAGVIGGSPVVPVSPGAPVVGRLHYVDAQLGILHINFAGYRMPTERHQYIVKAMPVFNLQIMGRLREQGIDIGLPFTVQVNFFEFLPDGEGLFLYVTDSGQPINAEIIKQLEFMIEVSYYEFG